LSHYSNGYNKRFRNILEGKTFNLQSKSRNKYLNLYKHCLLQNINNSLILKIAAHELRLLYSEAAYVVAFSNKPNFNAFYELSHNTRFSNFMQSCFNKYLNLKSSQHIKISVYDGYGFVQSIEDKTPANFIIHTGYLILLLNKHI